MSNVPNDFVPPNAQATGLATASYHLTVAVEDQGDVFADPAAFAHWHRVAYTFAHSKLVPKHLRGPDNVPDILIALDMARRMHLNPLQVLQSLYVVNETAGWYTTFLTALAQAAGWDLDYEVRNLDPGQLTYDRPTKTGSVKATIPNLGIRCVMTRRDGVVKRGIEVTSQQAIAARWANNEQYVHSTEHMLTNRAATFAIRRHDPKLLLGLKTSDELEEERESPPPAATYEEPATKKKGADAVRAAISGGNGGAVGVGRVPTTMVVGSSGTGGTGGTRYQEGLQELDKQEQATAERDLSKKPAPCDAVHPVTGIRCTTEYQLNPNTKKWMLHKNHGYEPEGENFRVWWDDDGTIGPITREEMSAVRQQRAAEDGVQAPPEETDDPKLAKWNSVVEADLIASGLLTQPRGVGLAFGLIRRVLTDKLGAKRLISKERALSAANYGVTREMWTIHEKDGETFLTIPRLPETSAPAKEPVVLGAPEIAAALGKDADVWSPSDLESLIADEELAIRDSAESVAGIDDLIRNMAKESGLPVNGGLVSLDGSPAAPMRAFLARLRLHRKQR